MESQNRREIIYRERIVDIEFKISRLGIVGKEYYDLAQIKLKRHRSQISIARTQNVLLHAALGTLREKDRIARKNAGDLENLRKKAISLRVYFDHQRQRVFKRQRKLEWQIIGTHSAELECAGVLDPNTSPELVIRWLEQRIVWMQFKIQDVQILVKHYEGTLQPLREEWTFYDAKLAALQAHVNIKNQECELLINTHHDAIRARDAAKIELEELLAFLVGYGKKGIISPELKLKILRAIKEIKSVMDVESMREMYHQYLVQEKQSSYLESIYEELSKTLDLMRDEDYRRTRKKSSIKDKEYATHVIEGTKMMVRRQTELRGSFPLLQLLERTKKLVDRLHEGQVTLMSEHKVQKEVLEKCKLSMMQILQSLYRKLKERNKDIKRAEYEAREAAHWAREAAEVAIKKSAAEAARKKYEERAAASEARRQEQEAIHQTMEDSQEGIDEMEEGSQTHRDEPSILPEDEIQQDTKDIVSTTNEGVISSSYQLAEETGAADMVASTVIFLPSFQDAPSDDREISTSRGSASASPSDETEPKIERPADPTASVVLSDDESPGASTVVDDGRDGRTTPPKVVGATLTETGLPAVSSRFGRSATFTETRSPSAVSSRFGRSATFAESRSPSPPPRDKDKGVSPIASLLEPDQHPTVGSASEESTVEQRPMTPTEPAWSGDSKETVHVLALSSKSTPAGEYEEGANVESALSDIESPGVGTSDEVTKEPIIGSDMTTSEKSASPQLALEESSPVAGAVPSTSTISDDDPSEKAAEKKGEGGPLKAIILSSETVQSPAEESPSLQAFSSDVTKNEILPGSPSGAPVASGWEPGEKLPSDPETASLDESLPQTPGGRPRSPNLPGSPSGATDFSMQVDETVVPHTLTEEMAPTADVPGIERELSAVKFESGVQILSQKLPSVEVLPSSLDKGLQAAEVPTSELLPATPTEAQGAAGTSIPGGRGVSVEDSGARRPGTAEAILSRSPSGAPIASAGWEPGAVVPASEPETVSLDESSLPQTPGGLRSPNLPRSPSGAPIATAVRFSFGSNLSETSSPVGSSGTDGSPTDTARPPTTSLDPMPKSEARLSEKEPSEPEAGGTSDPPK